MNYRALGKSDIEVSEVSLGCWTMGGLNHSKGHSSGWADIDPREIQDAIKTGIDTGVNHFDNADVYGNGAAEKLLASSLANLGIDTQSVVIASKVGHFSPDETHPYEPRNIRRQCEQSLKNLNREYLDIYYFHHGNFGPNDERLRDAAETMHSLQREGKIRVIGQSAYQSSQFERITPIVKPTVLQGWAHAMDTRFIEPGGIVGQLLKKNELSFVAFSPLNQGLLLDKYSPERPPAFDIGDHRRNAPKFSRESLEILQPKLEALKKRFGQSTVELASVALRYVLNFPNVACVIPGFRNAAQVTCNLSAVHQILDEQDMSAIREIFLPSR